MLKKVIIILFASYWLLTLMYNIPNNPIKIEYGKFFYKFGIFFNQRWSFFAPPPKMNNRLYYSFYDDQKKEIGTFEVLEALSTSKKAKLPFNTEEEALDYILNGAINQLYQLVIRQREQLEVSETDHIKTIEELEKVARDSLLTNIHNIKEFKTLVNFSDYVLKNKIGSVNSLKTASFLKISISEVDIPKFYLRKSVNSAEKIFLESDFVDINKFKKNG
ncbi:hypothetical protein [Olivibacter oleidegradans]|uniref:Uncharacterized protein n=1 Tax=Olivibacter oleidegradans TaxID=760123 RepID=A0ABV6HS42_9SPHI